MIPRGFGRTAVAALLTTVAVTVPTGAWYSFGSRQVERQVELELKTAENKMQQLAIQQAERLAARLEVLREIETRRPFYHYQNLYHDPRGAAQGNAVTVSPLAQGPLHPLVDAHFQVDERGRLSLPTLNDDFPELGVPSTDATQCALMMDLEEVVTFLAAAEGGLDDLAATPLSESIGEELLLSRQDWQQHLLANVLYADLKYRQQATAPAGNGCRQRPVTAVATGKVAVTLGPFRWHGLLIGDQPTLVALRAVDTPVGHWTQGFAVSRSTLQAELSYAEEAEIVPLAELRKGQEQHRVTAAIAGTPWGVRLDAGSARVDAERLARQAWSRFLRFFVFSSLAAAVAGLLVVTMVYQSERLAADRARFAAHAAHELRTPLAGLRLYSEMLAEGLGDPARSRDYARRLASEAERLGRVVTNVLGFTRLERQGMVVRPQRGDLGAAVRSAYARQLPALQHAGAEVVLETPDDLPTVLFDRDAVSHIVQNLLDNAEKYTRDIKGRRIRVSLTASAKAVALSVADNGRGISRQLRRRLFRPFVRGVAADGPEGVGLGLVLVRALAVAHGGQITYADGPSGGAVFTVTFPR